MIKRPVPGTSLDESTEKSSGSVEPDSISTGETLLKGERFVSGEHLPPLAEGRYQVDEKDGAALLGKGGQGTVWRAYDKLLRREVALKRLHPAAVEDPSVVSAFLREARLTALLEHPGIVPLHDVGRDADGSLYLALRRIEGKSLFDTLAAAPGLDGRLALVPALVRACQAVAFAHERGVVHRDLKPQNIMLGRFGETYVLDWGLALVESRVAGAPDVTAPHQASGVVGTPAYMSPEQALGLAADARSDVWGLGACLYHLLTGQAPITGRSLQSAMGHASAGEVSPVLAVEPLAPRDLAAICEKALSQERSQRYPNASALAADLEAWLAGRTVSARTYSRGQLLRRALFANRRAVAVLGVGLLVLGGVLAFDELRVRRERNEARTFVRDLIRDLPRQVDASKANVELINTLTARAQLWLSRKDLSIDELEEACDVFNYLGSLNADTSAFPAARELYRRASELSARGVALQPGNARFVVCEVEAKAGLGYCETEAGDEKAGLQLYAEAWDRLRAWPGEWTAGMRLAQGELGAKWGGWAWGRDPELGRKLFIESARGVEPLMNSKVATERYGALRRGANAVTALWSKGQLPEAVALARRFYEAAKADCAEQTLVAQRVCLLPLSSYAAVAGWVDAPDAAEVQRRTLEVEAFTSSRDVDSLAGLYDSIILFLEQGLYDQSVRRARVLRNSEMAVWGKEIGPLAAVLAGDLEEVDAWGPLLEKSETGGLLALGLREAARGNYAEAARRLRAVNRERLWYDISWAAKPQPKFVLPEAARPAGERFIADFTKAYGAADMAGLGSALDELAEAFDALR
ncbi:MAG: serine/threonine-protein kinase [Archangium sp.]|nr:serine/threonine-protein kinase [Archangium sp.]